jgi:phage gp36-like protein
MPFLTKDDFANVIRDNVLDDITSFEDGKIEVCVEEVVSLMAGYLSNRYDTAIIFGATGDDRHKTVMMYCKDIVLYNLHSMISPRKIPRLRYDRYANAMNWLEMVSKQEINPPDLPIPDDGSKSYVQFGGNSRRNNQW